jgi:serine phosphatase RsbU (regulator of sigma subunit)
MSSQQKKMKIDPSQFEYMVAQTKSGLAGQFLIIVLMNLLLNKVDFPSITLYIWDACALLLLVHRYMNFKRYYNDQHRNDSKQASQWIRKYVADVLLMGVLWAVLFFEIIINTSPEYHYFAMAVGLGLAGAAIVTMGPVFIVYAAFVSPMLLALIVSFYFLGTYTHTIAALVTLLGLVYLLLTDYKYSSSFLLLSNKNELEAAHKLVNSSIQYASRIQRAILPPEDYFSSIVPNHFVLWEPRDVVGGDIYWCKPWGEGCLIILGDCTGHGVPGAFMTMLSAGALERAIGDISPGDVSGLLQRMHGILQSTLNQDSEHGHSDDGIEMGVCYLNADKSKVSFAGARLDLYVLENGAVNIIKGNKSGMGYRGIPLDQQFEKQEIETRKNMTFYLASDGIVDQVGSDTGWGVGRRRMMQWMVESGNLPLADQKAHIYNSFLAYQGSAKRRDDVSVIGFKV